ncbi:MAG TPA: hypothetical protein EYP05_09490 [Piscirickettsiaceae bacterium]|nr:hypothetical protein [Piscirickettsiaceae bacterium]HIQ40926.1 hypothetical protein [Sulfurivirga caldicuralii]
MQHCKARCSQWAVQKSNGNCVLKSAKVGKPQPIPRRWKSLCSKPHKTQPSRQCRITARWGRKPCWQPDRPQKAMVRTICSKRSNRCAIRLIWLPPC